MMMNLPVTAFLWRSWHLLFFPVCQMCTVDTGCSVKCLKMNPLCIKLFTVLFHCLLYTYLLYLVHWSALCDFQFTLHTKSTVCGSLYLMLYLFTVLYRQCSDSVVKWYIHCDIPTVFCSLYSKHSAVIYTLSTVHCTVQPELHRVCILKFLKRKVLVIMKKISHMFYLRSELQNSAVVVVSKAVHLQCHAVVVL